MTLKSQPLSKAAHKFSHICLNTKARYIRKSSLGRSRLICQSPLKCAGQFKMAGDLNSRKVSCKWIVVSLLSLLPISIKYLYLTPSSTSQITILWDESNVEELTGSLTVNNREIVRVDKPRKKNSTPGKFFFSRNHIYNRIMNWYCTSICNVFSNNC